MAIKLLDKNTISKIAAGEVIENPASVVKELVENAIDAKASNIVIELKEGGTRLIKVVDDGMGFAKEDIKLAFLQHATSKLSSIVDLDTIKSFGFRGEALSSIASVSKVVLVTKSREENKTYGYRYCIDFGNETDVEEIASNIGTSIEVIDLFKNVPVRKKFLKGFPKENALVEDLVMKFAMSNPNIAFTLIVDGRTKFSSTGNNDLKSIIYSIYGREVLDSLIYVDNEFSNVAIKGYIAKPIVVRNTKNDEIYFVNKRYIKSKVINKAIEGAYEEYLMQHKFPLVVLDIDIDSSKVDVNVHPKKMEVRFSSDELIYMCVYNVIHDALKNENLIHEEKLVVDDIVNIDSIQDNESDSSYIALNMPDERIELSKQSHDQNVSVDSLPSLSKLLNYNLKEGLNLSNFNNNISNKVEEKSFIQKSLTEDHRYIGQIFNTYILIEFEDKLYIIDQHAAHEKINFERIMKSYNEGNVVSQKIFPSIILKLTPLQYEALASNIDAFTKIGFEIELFGDNDIKVDAVPYNIFNIGNEKLLLDMIDSFADAGNKEQYSSIVEKIASISCKKAIKANYILSENEVKQLLRDLFKLDNPYNCPHGRPTIISLSKYEFEKKFGRVV